MNKEELNGVINFWKWVDKESIERNIRLNKTQKELIKLAIDEYCEEMKRKYGIK